MQIFAPREPDAGDPRVPVVPATVAKLARLGAAIVVETSLGLTVNLTDDQYREAGAAVSDRASGFGGADMVLRLRKPDGKDVKAMRKGTIHISFLDPFNDPELIRLLAAAGISAISMEMVPRSTIAQKMDALSSQANLAGYNAVILAAGRLDKVFPMMMTPSGTITPARVFIIGVGVAGLQAIATAKRLGAAVEAFDTRPVVEEQVKSLGARFVKADLGATGQTAQGYAVELTPEQMEKQRAAMAEHCAQADVVITTAQLFGKKAPRVVTTEMVGRMKPGSVVVDMAVESGGNVECSRLGETVSINGVKVLGIPNLAGCTPRTASDMYSNNLGNFVEHFWDKDNKTFKLDPGHEIFKSCLITHGGAIVNETIRKLLTP